MRSRPALRTVALAIMALGLLICLVPIAAVGYGIWQEDQLTRSWSSQGHQGTAVLPSPPFVDESATPGTTAPPAPTPAPRQSIGAHALFTIRVPRIGYYAAVRQGISPGVLATGPGHYPTTAEPGQRGLVGIAAHNTFWIPFGTLGPGDTVILETRSATFTYRITGTRIVNPDDRTVLVRTRDPRLVLTTCWPLWAGSLATKRLAILASKV